MDNKSRFLFWLKAAFMIIWGSLALGTSIAVWNAAAGEAPNGFICGVAVANLIFTGAGIFFFGKNLKIKEVA